MLKSSVRLHMVVWLIAVQVNCTAFTGVTEGSYVLIYRLLKDVRRTGRTTLRDKRM